MFVVHLVSEWMRPDAFRAGLAPKPRDVPLSPEYAEIRHDARALWLSQG